MKKIIRLTESDLHRIVKESVRKIIAEEEWKGTKDLGSFKNQWDVRGPLQMAFMNGYNTCTFQLYGDTFSMSPTRRGYCISLEGTNFTYDAHSLDEAIHAALQYASGNWVRNADGSVDWL